MTTWSTIRQRVGYELDLLDPYIPNAFFDAAAAGSITSSDRLRNSKWGSGEFSSKKSGVYRPAAASAADYWRWAAKLTNTSGLLAHSGANYADTTTTTENIEVWRYGVRPDTHLVEAANRALEFLFFDTMLALSHLSPFDGDMSLSTDTNWTDVLTPTTSAKATTARRTPFGMRSYNLINNAADEGTQSATLPVGQSHQISAFTIGSVNVGTASFRPYDVTNSAGIGTALTHSEETPQLMCFRNQVVPSTCKEIATQHLGTTTTSDIFWNQAWLYDKDNLRITLPSVVTEKFHTPYIFQARPRYSTDSEIYPAGSLELVALTKDEDYWLQANANDANATVVQFVNNSAYDWPLFVQARRPYSSLITYVSGTESTDIPEKEVHLLVPMIKLKLLDSTLKPNLIGSDNWTRFRVRAVQELTGASGARPVEPVSRSRPRWGGVQVA